MPAPIDLTGRVFGKLTVSRLGPTVQYGGPCRSWVCRCECGEEITVPQKRLPYAKWIERLGSGRIVTACQTCSGGRCEICGAVIPRKRLPARTCKGECEETRRKRRGREAFRRRIERDPDLVRRNRQRRRERAARDPEYAERLRQWYRDQHRRRRERADADPEYAERLRRQSRDTYARHAERIQAERRARFQALSPEQQEAYLEAMRLYCRRWKRKQLAESKSDPERYRRLQDLRNEYQRLRHERLKTIPTRTCAICGHQWEDRKYKVLCQKPECSLEYQRDKQVRHRARRALELFRDIERDLARRARESDGSAG